MFIAGFHKTAISAKFLARGIVGGLGRRGKISNKEITALKKEIDAAPNNPKVEKLMYPVRKDIREVSRIDKSKHTKALRSLDSFMHEIRVRRNR